MKKILFFTIFGLVLSANNVLAHPGNTASDGCHYCRTNCDKWGVAWNERHCHGSKASSSVNQNNSSGGRNSVSSAWYVFGGAGLASAGFWIKNRSKK